MQSLQKAEVVELQSLITRAGLWMAIESLMETIRDDSALLESEKTALLNERFLSAMRSLHARFEKRIRQFSLYSSQRPGRSLHAPTHKIQANAVQS